MNKFLKAGLFLLVLIIVLWIVGRATNTFQYYYAPTSANEPTIKKGSKFFASNLIKPKRLDFICFNGEIPNLGRQIRTYRLCGLSGDVVEIRKGELFVNHDPIDKKLKLQHLYNVPADEFERIKDSIYIDPDFYPESIIDSVSLFLEDSYVSKNSVRAVRKILPANIEDESMYKLFTKKWNQDNFGPVTVPDNKYFVLGDNRNNAYDSRYSGFIEKRDYVATVLWKH